MLNLRIFIVVVFTILLNGCATSRSTMSYVSSELTPADAEVLARDTAAHLFNPVPPAKSTLVLDKPVDQKTDVLTPIMITQLRASGYGVIEADPKTGPKPEDGIVLRYLASPFENGFVLRLQYLGTEATRYYPRSTNSGLLTPQGGFTVREAGQ